MRGILGKLADKRLYGCSTVVGTDGQKWGHLGVDAENGTEDIWWILEGQDYPRLWWETFSELVN